MRTCSSCGGSPPWPHRPIRPACSAPRSSSSIPFSRTTGPVIGAFLTGLREQVLLGIQGDGRPRDRARPPSTTAPPATSSPSWSRWARPARSLTWAWVRNPMPKHPLHAPLRLGAGAARRRRRGVPAGGRRGLASTPCPPGCGCSPDGPTSARAPSTTSPAGSPMPDGRGHPAPGPRGRGAGALRAHPRPSRLHLHRRRGHHPVPQAASPRGRSSGSGPRAGRSTCPPAGPTRSWAWPPRNRSSCHT